MFVSFSGGGWCEHWMVVECEGAGSSELIEVGLLICVYKTETGYLRELKWVDKFGGSK